MKMTKLIREYITEEITKKYQPLIDAINKKYDLESGDNVMRETTKEIREYAKNLYRERLAPYYTEEGLDFVLENYSIHSPHFYSVRPIATDKYNEEISNVEAKRDKAIKNILITMELEGSKADLDKMLAAICPEEV